MRCSHISRSSIGLDISIARPIKSTNYVPLNIGQINQSNGQYLLVVFIFVYCNNFQQMYTDNTGLCTYYTHHNLVLLNIKNKNKNK